MRYWNSREVYQADFDPATFRWSEVYDPDMVIATFYLGLRRTRARTYIEPVFGSGPEVMPRVIEVNPADLLFRPGLPAGELAIYVNYPGKDNYNFDAQAESFAWLAPTRHQVDRGVRSLRPPQPAVLPRQPHARVSLAGLPPAAAGGPGNIPVTIDFTPQTGNSAERSARHRRGR